MNNEKYPTKGPDFPSMVHIPICYVCNSECIHCPYSNTNAGIRKEYADKGWQYMDTELFRKAVTEVGAHKGFVRITGGGEPTLHKDFCSLMRYAKDVGCRVGLITNGSNWFQDELSAWRLTDCLDVIEFSVDAMDRKTYESIRKGLNWERLLLGIANMLEIRRKSKEKPKVIVSVIDQTAINGKIDEIERFWYNFGVDYVIKRKYLTYDTLQKRDTPDSVPLTADSNTPCPYPFERLEVNVNGDIKFCIYDIKSAIVLGNIKDMTIAEAWNCDYIKKVRSAMVEGRWDEISYCRDCKDRLYKSWTHNYAKVLKEVEAK